MGRGRVVKRRQKSTKQTFRISQIYDMQIHLRENVHSAVLTYCELQWNVDQTRIQIGLIYCEEMFWVASGIKFMYL